MTKVLKARVSTSYEIEDVTLILHLLASADCVDPERLKTLRQHPRFKALLRRFQGMLSKAKPRIGYVRTYAGCLQSERSLAVVADIRRTRGNLARLPAGARTEIAVRHNVTLAVVERLVRLVAIQDEAQTQAAE